MGGVVERMTADRGGNSSIIGCRSENASPIAAVAGEEPNKRANSRCLLCKQLRVIEIDKQSRYTAIFWRELIKKIEDTVNIGVAVCIDSRWCRAFGKKIGNRLPKYSPAQPRLARPFGMDPVMHDNSWIIDGVVS